MTSATVARDPLIAEATERWNACNEAEEEQRKAILAAKQFRAGDQWDEAIKIARRGGQAIQGLPAQPPRPCFVIDRLSQPIRQISNAIKTADFTFTVLPNSKGADQATADILRGYMRRVQNQARDESPVEWAADGAVEGGLGWFRIRTKYVHETWSGDPNDPAIFDQELCLERITNNLTVYCDPYAMRPTRSDALYMLVTQDLGRDEFTRRWPKADLRGLEQFETTGDAPKGWISKDNIRIAEYWRIVFTDRLFYWTKDGQIGEGKPPKGLKAHQIRMQRTMRVPTVKGSIINAFEELEKMGWAGSRIPLIPVIGEELNIDGQVKLRGVIEGGMDPQRMVNYSFSGAAEIFALAPKNAPIVPAASVANYQNIWKTRTWTNWSYLPIDVFDKQGRPIPPPMFNPTEPPIQAAVALMNISEESIKASTSTFDPSLGQTNPMQQSGVAIQSLQTQSDAATANYPDNVRRALVYAGELMLEVIPKITRKGQILHIVDVDEQVKQVMVGQVFNYGGINGGPKTKIPQASADVTPEAAALSQGLHQFFDLDNGTYHVTVDIAKASATRLMEGQMALGALIPKLPPEMAAVLTPEYIENLSMPDAQKMADLARKALPPQLQPQPEGGQQPNPQVQQLQQQVQQLTQQLQGKSAEKQAEMQGQMQIEQMKAQANFQLQMALQEKKSATDIAIAHINASKDADKSLVEAQEEQLATGLQIAHEEREAAKDRAHDVGLAAQAHVHETLQNAQTHQQSLQQVAVGGAIKSQQQADAAQFQAQQTAQQAQQQQQQPSSNGGAA